ncbi:hypothetical protein SAURM35S_03272 [Streptomyces aurantiogriseus]
MHNTGSGGPHTVGETAGAPAAAYGGPEPVVTGEYRLGRWRTGVGAAAAGVGDARQVLLGDAAAAVRHRHHRPLGRALGGDRHRADGGGRRMPRTGW